jgi:type I restriction enzyme S subunit
MTEWLSGALDDFCEVEYGTRVTRKRDGGTKYPVYGGGGATFNLDDFNRQDQMIVSRFAMSEECVRFVPGKFFLNDSGLTVRTRDESKMSQEFLDHQLLARSNEIYATARGTAQKNMDMTMFRSMKLAIPDSLEEQKRIVGLLDAATARVTELTACYEQGRAQANNLYISALNELFEGCFSDTKAAHLTIEEICKTGDGNHSSKYPKNSELVVKGVPFVRANNIVDGNISPINMRFISEKKHNELKKGHLKTGDVLITNRGEIGSLAIVDAVFNGSNLNSQIAWLRVSSLVINKYLYYFLCSSNAKAQFFQGTTGAALQQLTISTLKKIRVPVVPLTSQIVLINQLDKLKGKSLEMVAAYESKLTAAKNLRQSVLEAAFAGAL